MYKQPVHISRRIVGPRPAFLLAAGLFQCWLAGSAVAEVRVVATINPVHSLVSAVMSGVDEPHLIVRGASSPHNFSMRPSDAGMLEDAHVVFLIGEAMETSIAGSIDSLARNARVIELAEVDGLIRRSLRVGGNFEEDHEHAHGGEHDEDADHEDEHGDEEEHGGDGDEEDHGDHGDEEEHGDHGDEEEHGDHGDEEEHGDHGDEDEHGDHDGEEEHGDHDGDVGHADEHGAFDLHVWLDPVNAGVMVGVIAEALAEADPANAATYAANATTLQQRLDELVVEIAASVASVRGEPFIVFHDAYRYFEDRFGVAAVGSAVVSADRSPGVRRIRELQNKVRDLGVRCVMSEPQFEPRLVNVIVEGTQAKAGSVDPLGATIESGPELYFALLRNMAASFKDCLSG